jgi:hypothetical protein
MKDLKNADMFGVHGTTWEPGYSKEFAIDITKYYEVNRPGKYLASVARRVKILSAQPYFDERDSVIVRDIPIVVVDKRGQAANEHPEKQEPEEEKPKSLPPQAQRMEEATDWLLPGLIVAGVVLAGVVLFLLLRLKRANRQ